MTTSPTALLGLALPATGELDGTWGTTINDSITSLLDAAVAGTTTLSTDADVTLTTTNFAANTARQAVLLCSGARTVLRTITAPARSKTYVVINATTGGFGVKVVGVGPTTGVTVNNGEKALIAWNGSDFVIVATSIIDLASEVAGILAIANGGTNGTATPTANGISYGTGTAYAFTAAGSSGEVLRATTSSAPTWGQVALTTDVSGILPAAKGGTGVANNALSTLTISGAYPLALTLTNTTAVTLPASGTLLSTAAVVTGAQGGTGVNNSTRTITLGGNISTAGALTTAGAFGLTLTTTNTTSVTLPASGTLLSTAAVVTVAQGGTNTSSAPNAYGVIIGNGTGNGYESTLEGPTGTVLKGRTGNSPTWGQVALTTDVSGILPAAYGGTGVANNSANTITFTGNYSLGLTLSNNTSVTLPTSGTLLSTAALVTPAQGGTNNGFFAVSGPAGTTKTFTFPNVSTTVLTTSAVITPSQGGTGTGNNDANTISFSGSYPLSLTLTGITSLTMPTSGTVVSAGEWITYTPVVYFLSGSVYTVVTSGTYRQARYKVVGNMVYMQFYVNFSGGVGTANQIAMSLPIPCAGPTAGFPTTGTYGSSGMVNATLPLSSSQTAMPYPNTTDTSYVFFVVPDTGATFPQFMIMPGSGAGTIYGIFSYTTT